MLQSMTQILINKCWGHYNDVIIGTMASQITSLTIVYSTVYTGAYQRLECGTWYHHPRRLQCVLSRNLRIFKAATWHYRCRHNLKNNCIWDNLQCCLLVPRSPSKPVMLTFDLQSRKMLFIEIVFGMYNLGRQLWYWHLLTRHCPCKLLLEPTSPKHEYREKLWGHPVTSSMTSSP